MSVRRIKAHYAVEQGDVVRITTESNRLAYIAISMLLMFVFVLYELESADPVVQSLLVLFAACLGFLLSSGQVEREVPRIELVEIKPNKWSQRVTVILDDERSKHARSISSPKPTA